jgi:uncharacterized protein (TIGR02452 family)
MTREQAFEMNKLHFEEMNSRFGTSRYTNNELYFEDSFDALQNILPEGPFVGKRNVVQKFAGEFIQDGLQGWSILNFASAKYPGGGVAYGSIAQEEDICRNTMLYFYIREYWNSHYRANAFTGAADNYLLKNFIIYSKNVATLDSDLNPTFTNDYITSAAPDLRLLTEKSKFDKTELQLTWVRRIKAVLASAYKNDAKKLVLGPWGCGVFRNDPEFLYLCFDQLLQRFGSAFEEIVFLAPDELSYNIFSEFMQ